MTVVSIGQLKTEFEDFIKRAEAGEEITITRRGKPVAKLAPLNTALANR